MRYLYGDSTPSALKTNFLAYVRDAMEFCVHLLLAQDRITVLRGDRTQLDDHAEAERVRIAGLRALVIEAAEAANTEGAESMSLRAVKRVLGASEQAITSTLAELDAKLEMERAEIAATDRDERTSCLDAFGKWIALHQPNEGTWTLDAHLDDSGKYTGETSGTTTFGVEWSCALELQKGHPMANGIKVGDLVTQIELSIPEGSGWLKKGKTRPQRIDAYSIDAFSTDGSEYQIRLRAAPRGPTGLDVAIDGDTVRVTLAGVKDTVVVEVGEDDRQRLLTLRDRIFEALTNHSTVRRRVVTATIDDDPLVDGEDLGVVATRLIEAAAPIVLQIRNHSLSPNELVIRRLLGNDRREEIFVTTASLLEKLGRLPRALRSMFAPLGLEWQRAQTPQPFAAIAAPGQRRRAPSEPESPTIEVVAGEPPEDEDEDEDEDEAENEGEDEAADDGKGGEVPAVPKIPIDARGKDALASTMKRIVAAQREGRTALAYSAYAALFDDADFAAQRPQDQRQVLKLMVLSKVVPTSTEEVQSAFHAALLRLQALALDSNDPGDREMIVACEKRLAEPPA